MINSAHIIVFGNEKGGSGKSTTAMHTAIGLLRLGYKVASIDLDARQGTLTRYMANRFDYIATTRQELPAPAHMPIEKSVANLLTDQEKRLLQAGLAFANFYNGLIDGAWGSGSQRALERFTAESGGSAAFVTNADAVLAAMEAFTAINAEGWERQYVSALDMSFLVPTAALVDGETSDAFVNMNVSGRSIGYSMTIDTGAAAETYHAYTARQAVGEVYTVRRPKLWITSARTPDGVTLYTRSDLRAGGWSTLMISGADRDAGALAAITGSIEPGYAPAIGISPGRLATGVEVLARIVAWSSKTTRCCHGYRFWIMFCSPFAKSFRNGVTLSSARKRKSTSEW